MIAPKTTEQTRTRFTTHRFEAEVLDEIAEAVVALGLEGTVEYLNHAALSMFGTSSGIAVGVDILALADVPDPWRELLRRGIERARRREPLVERTAHLRHDGASIVTEWAFKPHRAPSGDIDGIVLIMRDVTGEVAANELSARRGAQQHALAELSTAALATSDLVTLSRRAVEVLTEVLDADHAWVDALQGSSYAQLAATGAIASVTRGATDPASVAVGLVARHGYGATVLDDLSRLEGDEALSLPGSLVALPIPLGATRGLVGVHHGEAFSLGATEVSFVRAVGNVLSTAADRIAREEHIHHSALHDGMTGLPNRTLLMDRIEHACARVSTSGESVVVLVFDLDHYTVVNDALGRSVGDRLMKLLVRHLTERLSERHTLARLGGDTFALLAECPGDRRAVSGLAEHLLEVVAEPLTLDGTNHYLSVAVGIAVHQPGQSSTELLRNADAAMYVAKEQGGARYQIFDDTLLDRAMERLTLTNDLREAVEADELVLHYQPQIDLRTGAVIDLEALVRWDHPQMGRLMPDDFLGVAEATGNMEAIGRWVVGRALEDLSSWSDDARLADVGISINLSVGELLSETFNSELAAMLERPDIDASRVTFEITESAAMDDPEIANKALTRLRDLGARIAVDDFGTGYSSMVYLRRLPVDVLKIDREFTDGVAVDGSDDSAIVEATIGLGRALRLECVAEGVETADQEAALRRLGCERAQGWRYAKALPLQEALELARTR